MKTALRMANRHAMIGQITAQSKASLYHVHAWLLSSLLWSHWPPWPRSSPPTARCTSTATSSSRSSSLRYVSRAPPTKHPPCPQDMHYSNGQYAVPCSDILPEQRPCSDLNTTAFMAKVLDAEQPDLVLFSGKSKKKKKKNLQAGSCQSGLRR